MFAIAPDTGTPSLRIKSPEPVPKQIVELDEDGNAVGTEAVINVWEASVPPIKLWCSNGGRGVRRGRASSSIDRVRVVMNS